MSKNKAFLTLSVSRGSVRTGDLVRALSAISGSLDFPTSITYAGFLDPEALRASEVFFLRLCCAFGR